MPLPPPGAIVTLTGTLAAAGLPLSSVSAGAALGLAAFTGAMVWGGMVWWRARRGVRNLQAALDSVRAERNRLAGDLADAAGHRSAADHRLDRQAGALADQQRRARALERIVISSSRFGAAGDRGEVADKIVAAVADVTAFRRVVLFLWNETTRVFEPAGYAGWNRTAAEELVRRQVAWEDYEKLTAPERRCGSYYLHGLAAGSVLPPTPDEAVAPPRSWEQGAEMIVPLGGADGRPLGYLELRSPTTGLVPDAVEVGLLDLLVRQAVAAVETNRVIDRLAGTNAELSVAAEKLEDLAEMKRNFVANVSHELRTPLTSISAYSEMLQRNVDDLSDSARAEFLAIIQDESRRLSGVINDLLELNTLGRERPALVQQDVDLRVLLDQMVEGWRDRAAAQDQTFEIHCAAGDLDLAADGLLLRQMLGHIVGNALKFTPAGGTVRVAACEAGTAVRLTVEDTGIGIPQDKLGEIFDRFYQVDSSSTRRHSGQGVGLAICRDIVNHHDGRIWAENVEPHGARITVLLPRRAPVAQPHDPATLTGLPFEAGEFMQRLMHWLTESLGVGTAALMVPEPDGETLVIRAAVGLPEAVVQSTRVRPGAGYAGHVWATGRSLLLDDVTANALHRRDVSEPRYTTPSLLCVPLPGADGIVGVVTVNNRIDGRPLADDDRLALESLAPVVGDLLVRYEEWQFRARVFREVRESLRLTTAVGQQRRESLPGLCREIGLASARDLGLSEADLRDLSFALRYYDVGMQTAPPRLLHRAGPLDETERRVVEQHVRHGLEILAPLNASPAVRQIILYHHENHDGSGYPGGLEGDAIPPASRLLRVIDTLGALLERRPWRGALTLDEAVAELKAGVGTCFDPGTAEAVLVQVERRRDRIVALQDPAAVANRPPVRTA